MKEIKLQLTVDETNVILQALSTQPYTQVYALINKIRQQAEGQLEPMGNGEAKGPEIQSASENVN